MAITEQNISDLFKYFDEERYQDATDLLEKLSKEDINNHHIYYFQALCFIYMDQLDDAFISLGEVTYLNPNHIPSMHAIAYIFLRKGDFESAMDKWLAIQTIAPKDALVNTILNKVKNKQLFRDPLNRYYMPDFIQIDFKDLKKGLLFYKQKEDIVEPIKIENRKSNHPIQTVEKIEEKNSSIKIIPKKPRPSSLRLRFSLLCIAFIIVVTCLFLTLHHTRIKPIFIKLNQEPVLYSFQDAEIKQKMDYIQENIKKKERDYNSIILHINELYYSNITNTVKNTLRSIKKSISIPENSKNIGAAVSISSIMSNPILYQGVAVTLQGTVDNLLKRPQYISFDLKIGSDKIPHIYFVNTTNSSLPFDNKDSVETFGIVSLDEQQNLLIDDTSVILTKTAALG